MTAKAGWVRPGFTLRFVGGRDRGALPKALRGTSCLTSHLTHKSPST